MNSGNRLRKITGPLCAEFGPEDGVDPRLTSRPSGQRRPGRKSLQLCGQAAKALAGALADSEDDVLRDLLVAAVEPAPHTGRLQITVALAPSAVDHEPGLILERLAAAGGRLRTEVANAVRRRKAPELRFRVLR